jgi:hypothetical protein
MLLVFNFLNHLLLFPSNSGAALNTFFPESSPNFGILAVPLYIYIGDDSALVKSETYLVSSATFGSTITPTDAMAVTIAYKPSGDVLGIKGRNAVSPATGLQSDLTGEKTSSGYTIDSKCIIYTMVMVGHAMHEILL